MLSMCRRHAAGVAAYLRHMTDEQPSHATKTGPAIAASVGLAVTALIVYFVGYDVLQDLSRPLAGFGILFGLMLMPVSTLFGVIALATNHRSRFIQVSSAICFLGAVFPAATEAWGLLFLP